ncbi:glycoside hydrolase family 71/99-like protein [Compostibacter hankyongensis]|uniref:Xylosidase n=1 Tax=Compostibacter hankyongensis TaxID=1007089 RepID=A0ABP8G1J3_9BACT
MMRYLFISLLFCCTLPAGLKAQTAHAPRYPTYRGLVMAGYQGWFNTPGDGADRGWHHYQKGGTFGPGSSVIDFWPDVSEYTKTYKTDFVYKNGSPAYVFSPYDSSTVSLHFKWMQQYGIDGVFMQRFVSEIRNPSGKHHFNRVLDYAMHAATRYGRAICIMYDLSGMHPGEEQLVLRDIDELSGKYDLLHGSKSPTYLHEHGKPLVVVWGVGFNDHRRYGFKEAETIIQRLKKKGFSVMLGVPTYWRELKMDALPDEALHRLIRECDIIMPWFVGRYDSRSFPGFKELIGKDLAWCKTNGVEYAPLAFPGFSWKNMNGPDTRSIPRDRGNFFWQQVAAEKAAGAAMLYIAMFDEMNEGTAIFKCATSDRLPLNGDGSFTGIDPDLGSDYYLWLAGQAARWFHGQSGYGPQTPRR